MSSAGILKCTPWYSGIHLKKNLRRISDVIAIISVRCSDYLKDFYLPCHLWDLFPSKCMTLEQMEVSFFVLLNTLPSKKKATLDLGAFLTPIWGQRPHGVKKMLTGVISPILSHKSRLRLDLWLDIGETTPANNLLPLWGRWPQIGVRKAPRSK